MIHETVRQAFQNIWSNKFRTLLTMLGIIIGVMAVIVIVGLGNGMTQSIKDSFADMGTNILSVQIMGRGSRNVSVDAVYDIVESHPDLFASVSPSIGSVAVAFSISVGIGVLFGFLPARRAARLNPIEALRYD